jgi:hypothetical protein
VQVDVTVLVWVEVDLLGFAIAALLLELDDALVLKAVETSFAEVHFGFGQVVIKCLVE